MQAGKEGDLLFVYGTLRNNVGHRMHQILARSAACIGEGRVRGELYDLGAYPGLVLKEDCCGFVSGELYAIDPANARSTWEAIDEYEGCAPTNPEPHEYARTEVRVYLPDGGAATAYAYVLQRVRRGAVLIPGGDYLAWLKTELAFRARGLPAET